MDEELDVSALLGPLEHGMAIVRSVRRFNEGPNRASMYRAHYEEWVADLAIKLREHAGTLEELLARMAVVDADHERMLVLGNFGFEAWREAVDRRRQMLGDAAVATVFSELSAAELARVERTIRMLDPEDLELLASLSRPSADAASSEQDRKVARYDELTQGHLGGAALVASGCVRMWTLDLDGVLTTENAPDRHVGATITALGELVLRFMGMEAAVQNDASS